MIIHISRQEYVVFNAIFLFVLEVVLNYKIIVSSTYLNKIILYREINFLHWVCTNIISTKIMEEENWRIKFIQGAMKSYALILLPIACTFVHANWCRKQNHTLKKLCHIGRNFYLSVHIGNLVLQAVNQDMFFGRLIMKKSSRE